MALTGQTVDVSLRAPDQQSPITSGPVGEMQAIVNGMCTSFEQGGTAGLRVEKRWGFSPLTDGSVRSPVTGSVSSVIKDPTLMATLGSQLVIADQQNPVVLAENEGSYKRFPYVMPTNVLNQETIYTANTQATIPDGAAAGGAYCYTWKETKPITVNGIPLRESKVRVFIVDDDGTPIREPFTLFDSIKQFEYEDVKVKVVSDGTLFWIFYTYGNGTNDVPITVTVFDTSGVQLGTSAFDTITFQAGLAYSPWDVSFHQNPSFGVLCAYTGPLIILEGSPSFTQRIARFTWNGSTISSFIHGEPSYDYSRGVEFLTNNSGDAFLYLSGIGATVPQPQAIQVDTSFAVTHSYPAPPDGGTVGYGTDIPSNIAGYVNSASGGLSLFVSFINGTFQVTNYTRTFRLVTSGATTETQRLNTVSCASRFFTMPLDTSRHYVCMYYGSVSSTYYSATVKALGQPTYFLVDGTNFQTCGRWEYGSAAMDWVESQLQGGSTPIGIGSGDWHLATAFQNLSSVIGGVARYHVPMGYRAEQIVQTVIPTLNTVNRQQPFATSYDTFPSTIGIRDYQFGGHGRAVEYAGELFLPGPEATSFPGYQFSECGINLAPEQPALAKSHASDGQLRTGQRYGYVLVDEWTTPQGDRAKSQTAVEAFAQLDATSNQNVVTITGRHDFMTNHEDVVHSVYRTYMDAGVMSTLHRKVTSDLAPILNDKTGSSLTWTFVDKIPDIQVSVSEVLYSDTGELQHDPCPAFSTGCVFQNRVFVAAYDGRIWFSTEKTPGESLWFNSDTFWISMPTSERITALIPLENRLVIACENSMWFVPGGGFPDNTGAGGNIQTPQRLPFTNGCTGTYCLTRDGAIYASSASSLPWVITRGLENSQIGAAVVDDFEGRTITGIVVDEDQRVMITTDAVGADPRMMVYDVVSSVWYTWTPTDTPRLSATLRGRLVFTGAQVPASGILPAQTYVWRQVKGQYTDSSIVSHIQVDGVAIVTKIEIKPVHLGGVKNFKRVWRIHIYGQYLGDHDLKVDVTYDDQTVWNEGTPAIVTTYNFTPDPAKQYLYELPPTQETCASMAFVIQDQFPRSAGNSFALEMLAFYVGLEKGLNRIPTAARIPPNVPPVPPIIPEEDVIFVDSIAHGGALLPLVDTTVLATGAFAYVGTVGRYYSLVRGKSLAVDGITVVNSSTEAGAQWQSVNLTNHVWTTFAGPWYYDPANGSGLAHDENDGASSATPLHTFAEWNRRMFGATEFTLPGILVVEVMSSAEGFDSTWGHPSGFLTGTGGGDSGDGFIAFHGTPTPIAPIGAGGGVITGVTVATTNDAFNTISDTGLAGSWSGNSWVSTFASGKMIRNLSKTKHAWVVGQASAKVAYVDFATDTGETVSQQIAVNQSDFVVGESYEVCSVPVVPQMRPAPGIAVRMYCLQVYHPASTETIRPDMSLDLVLCWVSNIQIVGGNAGCWKTALAGGSVTNCSMRFTFSTYFTDAGHSCQQLGSQIFYAGKNLLTGGGSTGILSPFQGTTWSNTETGTDVNLYLQNCQGVVLAEGPVDLRIDHIYGFNAQVLVDAHNAQDAIVKNRSGNFSTGWPLSGAINVVCWMPTGFFSNTQLPAIDIASGIKVIGAP